MQFQKNPPIRHQSISPGTLPVDRRRFLAAAAAALAPLTAAGAAEPALPRPDFTFALVSDTHLGRSRKEEQTLAQLVEQINRSPAAFTLFAGDLVDNGQAPVNEKRYLVWKDMAQGLKKDWFAVPGNHDPDERFRKHIQAQTDFVLEYRGFRFLGFRDAEPNPGHDGVVTPEQVRWLSARAGEAARKGQAVVLLAHVIFHANRHPDVGWYIKKGREELGRLLQTQRQVAAFLAGHFHCGLRGWDDTFGLQEVVLPSASWNQNRNLQKAGGYNVQEFRPGLVLVEVYPRRWRLRYHPVGGEASVDHELLLRDV